MMLFEVMHNAKLKVNDEGDLVAISNVTNQQIRVYDYLKRYVKRSVELPNIRHRAKKGLLQASIETESKVWHDYFAHGPGRESLRPSVPTTEEERDGEE